MRMMMVKILNNDKPNNNDSNNNSIAYNTMNDGINYDYNGMT